MRRRLLCLLAASGLCTIAATAGAAVQSEDSARLARPESEAEARQSQVDYDGFVDLTNGLRE